VLAHEIDDAPAIVPFWICPSVKAATLQPSKISRHRPVAQGLLGCGVWRAEKRLRLTSDRQFPSRTPFDFAPFTHAMPAASCGASSPLSAASTASLRTAVIWTLTDTEPSPRASSEPRPAFTVAFVKPERDSNPNHAMNSSSARLYTPFCNRGGDAVQHQGLQSGPIPRPCT
jgi:hypothetical protein